MREYLNTFGLGKKLKEIRLIECWPEVVGLSVAKRTKNLFIKNRVLFVYLSSSEARAVLLRIRESLPRALNEKAGDTIIDEVVIR
jgi:predicted nucleic acid-binding Zn ribbon protein